MSCWVVPVVAAEFFKVSLEQIQVMVAEGKLPSVEQNGFTFVDVLPEVENLTLPLPKPSITPPPTYVALTGEELQALTLPHHEHPSDDEHASLMASESAIDEHDESFSWHAARLTASAGRGAPRQAA
ncbi:MAG: hypothetical protein IT448_03690 [Phycisphaerales bacterium]|nr:hypothetical protein [Phycisphaerales bacterium]